MGLYVQWGEGREQVFKNGGFLEREGRASLFKNPPFLRLSVSSEARSKVAPHVKGYTWVPVLWSFDKLQEVVVFFYLIYPLFKCFVNAWVDLRP